MANNGKVCWIFWRNGEPAEHRVHSQEDYLFVGSYFSLAELRAAPSPIPEAEEDGRRVLESEVDALGFRSNIIVKSWKL